MKRKAQSDRYNGHIVHCDCRKHCAKLEAAIAHLANFVDALEPQPLTPNSDYRKPVTLNFAEWYELKSRVAALTGKPQEAK